MAKNRQKMAKLLRKIDFLYNNFPKKAFYLRKCTQKKNRLRRKKKSKKNFAPAALYSWTPRGCYRISVFCASALIPGPKCHFSAKKAKKNFGPKMVRKWPKSGQKWPKLPQNRRNNWRGSPRTSQRIPKISENGQKRSHSAI